MPDLSVPAKRRIARLVRVPLVHWLMRLGIYLFAPRHRVGASLVAINEQGQIFMLQHVFHPYVPWGLPGGWVGHGEAPEECVLRELQEETGLTAMLGPAVYVAREPAPAHLTIAYLARLHPGKLRLSAEIIAADWFALDALPSPLFPFVEEAIRRAVQARAAMPIEVSDG